uniref:Keratin n=3 Tax=Aves TaxID=8782 RepID=A0A8C3KXG9_CHRPC
MSCFDLCRPCGPTPLANSCNEPCVRQCQDSRVVIQPSPVVVTLPGPILSSFPQNTAVGSSTSAAVGSILSEEGAEDGAGEGDDDGRWLDEGRGVGALARAQLVAALSDGLGHGNAGFWWAQVVARHLGVKRDVPARQSHKKRSYKVGDALAEQSK